MAVSLSWTDQPPRLEWPEGCTMSLSERRRIEEEHFAGAAPQQQQVDEVAELRRRVQVLEGLREDDHRRYRRLLFDTFGGRSEHAAKAGCDVKDAKDGIYLGQLTPGLLDAIAELVEAERAEHAKRHDEHAKRIEELEARPQMRFLGLYSEGVEYAPGSIVRRSGKIWVAQNTTRAVPGKGDAGDWMVMNVDGRDGRDAPEPKEPVLR